MGDLLVSAQVIDLFALSEEEARAVANAVRAIEDRWLRRGAGFATIGVATYLDVMCSDDAERHYYARIAESNRLIQEHFGWLIERVRATIETHFERPTVIDERVALPGFHIFHGCGITLVDHDSQHFDLQFRSLRWPFAATPSEVVSFTLAIELPAAGGGLDYWNFTEDDLARVQRLGRSTDMALIGRTKPHMRHPYRIGYMTVQVAPVMHRIAAIPSTSPGDHRITLQGHSMRRGEELVLYW
ncbi:hypothetical protein QH494_23685 [Sphingomonas sp. AR_OL41]|uniref:hypothetical protein n=1 Tax=Sphingomonas sp. AR_OL41 TaxID=3042729 RepID=UPI0024805589|nr:hypothetical protein [Sphingomonas sp. AR_OL41]MDH7975197.1 hypothetical protein [Sphingomonas sp. AR_OL41]